MIKEKDRFYVTTFCNFAHRVKDGKPIAHECYILNPDVLRIEANQGADVALKFAKRNGLSIHRGAIMRRGVRQ